MEKKRMIQIIRSVKGTLMAHPDNEDNSEFADRISSLKELEQALSMSGVSFPSLPKSRCCGRCNGIDDICVADTICDEHDKQGCEICYGSRDGS